MNPFTVKFWCAPRFNTIYSIGMVWCGMALQEKEYVMAVVMVFVAALVATGAEFWARKAK